MIKVPVPKKYEPIQTYASGSREREALQAAISLLKEQSCHCSNDF